MSKILREKLKEFRSLLGSSPQTFYLVFRHIPKFKKAIVRPDTEIVIEGAGGSANTFARVAFEVAQKRKVKIASHTHVAGQVLLAIQWNIPTMVLIRNPIDATVSLLDRGPYLSEKYVLKEYIRFYSKLMPYKNRFVIAPFEKVVTNFGDIIKDLNAKFGTNFLPFEHTEENLKIVFARLENVKAKPRPGSKTREHMKSALIRSLPQNSYLKKALLLYKLFMDKNIRHE